MKIEYVGFLVYVFICIICISLELYNKIIKSIKKIKNLLPVKKEMLYFREPVVEYSPFIHAKLLGKNIASTDVIISMILYLKEKYNVNVNMFGRLKVEEFDLLCKSEKYFVENYSSIIYENKANETKKVFNDLDKIIFLEMVDEGLIDISESKSTLADFINRKRVYKISDHMISFFCFFTFIFLLIFYMSYEFHIPFVIISWSTMSILLIIKAIWLLKNYSLEVVKTQKGHEITQKLRAQKRFLKSFTLISSKRVKDRVLYDKYIRAGIFFNLKGKLDEEAKNYYKELEYLCLKYHRSIQDSTIATILMVLWILTPWIMMIYVAPIYYKTFFIAGAMLPVLELYIVRKFLVR